MSASPRLRSDLWIDAYRRRVELGGGFVAIRRRGVAEAGAIFIVITDRSGAARVFGPAPQSFYDEGATSRRFIALNDTGWDGLQIQTMLDKQLRFDPDLWMIDVDDTQGRHFLLEDELQSDRPDPDRFPDLWKR